MHIKKLDREVEQSSFISVPQNKPTSTTNSTKIYYRNATNQRAKKYIISFSFCHPKFLCKHLAQKRGRQKHFLNILVTLIPLWSFPYVLNLQKDNWRYKRDILSNSTGTYTWKVRHCLEELTLWSTISLQGKRKTFEGIRS